MPNGAGSHGDREVIGAAEKMSAVLGLSRRAAKRRERSAPTFRSVAESHSRAVRYEANGLDAWQRRCSLAGTFRPHAHSGATLGTRAGGLSVGRDCDVVEAATAGAVQAKPEAVP